MPRLSPIIQGDRRICQVTQRRLSPLKIRFRSMRSRKTIRLRASLARSTGRRWPGPQTQAVKTRIKLQVPNFGF
jgi:hypothetical protein